MNSALFIIINKDVEDIEFISIMMLIVLHILFNRHNKNLKYILLNLFRCVVLFAI